MIEIPDRMKKFPLWKNIYPIHYTVFINKDGTPDFKVMHEPSRVDAFNKNLCHLCGERMLDGLFAFIGGPNCLQHHHFIDGTMHTECAEYAAAICPFLNNTKLHYSTKTGKILLRPEKMYLCLSAKYMTKMNTGDRKNASGIQANYPNSPGQIVAVAGDWISVTEIKTEKTINEIRRHSENA